VLDHLADYSRQWKRIEETGRNYGTMGVWLDKKAMSPLALAEMHGKMEFVEKVKEKRRK
jgi:hypothetical protein